MTLMPPAYGESLNDIDLPRRAQQPGRAGEDDSADKKRARQAWLQEMERANLSEWFQPFAVGRSVVTPAPDKVPAKPEPRYLELRPAGPSGFATSRALNALSSRVASVHAASEQFLTAGHSTSDAGGPATANSITERGNAASTQRQSFAESRHTVLDSSTESSIEASSEVSAPGSDDSSVQGIAANATGGVFSDIPDMRTAGSGAAPTLQTTVLVQSNTGLTARPVASVMPWQASFAAAVEEAVLPNALAYFSQESSSELPTAQGAASESEALLNRISKQVDSSPKRLEVTAVLSGRVSVGAAPQNSAPRLHANWSSDGLNLWVGMNGTAQQVTTQAAVIVNTLQRTLRNQGERLCRVVCNGAVVYDAMTSSNTSRFDDFSSVLDRYNAGHPTVGLFSFPSPKEAP